MSRHLIIGIISVLLFLFQSSTAYAYLDPGSGSYACQVFLASLLGFFYLLKLYWGKIRAFLSRLDSKDGNSRDV
ncbi:MAG: hypothetical protein FJ009_10835 [Chloroflexi bacterium]|nr:hypothetical protein [Chloroflexota bacterium]